MLPPITDRILWDIATDFSGIRRLLDDVQPTVTLMLHEINRWGKILAFWSQERNIPAFSVQEGMYYGDKRIYTGHNEYSTSLVWGEKTKEKLVDAGNDPRKIEVLGHAHLKKRWESAVAASDLAWSSLPPHFQGKNIITVYVTGITIAEQFALDPMMEGLKNSPYRLVFQSAIMGNLPTVEKLKQLLLPYQDVAFYSPKTEMLWQQAAISDVICIWGCSTFGLEMAWAGKPLAEMYSPGQSLDFEAEGVAVPAMMTPDQQTGKIRTALSWIERALEQHASEEHREKVAQWVNGYIADPDAAEKFAGRMLS